MSEAELLLGRLKVFSAVQERSKTLLSGFERAGKPLELLRALGALLEPSRGLLERSWGRLEGSQAAGAVWERFRG